MTTIGTYTGVTIPSLGLSYVVGKDTVIGIQKTDKGVAIHFENKKFVEYTDVRCIFSGKSYTETGRNIGSTYKTEGHLL